MVGIRNFKSNDHVQFTAKNIKANFIACELAVNMVVTFGVVLYCSQLPVNYILYFGEWQLVVLSHTKYFVWKLFSQM